VALYAFDGTGNQDETHDSSVLEFFRAFRADVKNSDPDLEFGSLYLKGIGTAATTKPGESLSMAFGVGGHRRVRKALDRLENNQLAGDKTIHVVGFSRGAALALSFANEVAHKYPELTIGFIGLWDVVGQFGVPGKHENAGHDLRPPRNAERICHAMALDESRLLFPLTRLSRPGVSDARICEVWFRGVHSDVGGGNGNSGLNWIALHWMIRSAEKHGLIFDPDLVAAHLARRIDSPAISDHRFDAGNIRRLLTDDLLHSSVQLVPGVAGRPHNNPSFTMRRIDDDGTIA
jgi:uncharacterized protein (DUF2235 family)